LIHNSTQTLPLDEQKLHLRAALFLAKKLGVRFLSPVSEIDCRPREKLNQDSDQGVAVQARDGIRLVLSLKPDRASVAVSSYHFRKLGTVLPAGIWKRRPDHLGGDHVDQRGADT
jgi:hypothetical protein